MASVRSACAASASLRRASSVRRSSLSGTAWPSSRTWRQCPSRISGAPLEKARSSPASSGSRWIVVCRLRSDVKGVSATRGRRASSDSVKRNLRAATTSIPSVGSPCTRQRSSLCVSVESLTRAAAFSGLCRAFPQGREVQDPVQSSEIADARTTWRSADGVWSAVSAVVLARRRESTRCPGVTALFPPWRLREPETRLTSFAVALLRDGQAGPLSSLALRCRTGSSSGLHASNPAS
jgi:hypothetical protein